MFENWYVVRVATVGSVAAFKDEQDALDHANALRDVIGEARGLTSAVSVRQYSDGMMSACDAVLHALGGTGAVAAQIRTAMEKASSK